MSMQPVYRWGHTRQRVIILSLPLLLAPLFLFTTFSSSSSREPALHLRISESVLHLRAGHWMLHIVVLMAVGGVKRVGWDDRRSDKVSLKIPVASRRRTLCPLDRGGSGGRGGGVGFHLTGLVRTFKDDSFEKKSTWTSWKSVAATTIFFLSLFFLQSIDSSSAQNFRNLEIFSFFLWAAFVLWHKLNTTAAHSGSHHSESSLFSPHWAQPLRLFFISFTIFSSTHW